MGRKKPKPKPPEPQYDMRKQSIYLPKDILDKILKIKSLQNISTSRVMADCFRLVSEQYGKINWNVDGVVLRHREFREAMK